MMQRRVAVRAVILQGGKLLCLKLKDYRENRVLPADFWCVPGGGLDPGEPILGGLKREIIEELGVEPVIGRLLYIQQFAHHETEQMELFFHVTNASDFLHINLSKTSHGEEEIADYGFIDPTKNKILPEFLKTEDLQQTINQNGPAKLISYL